LISTSVTATVSTTTTSSTAEATTTVHNYFTNGGFETGNSSPWTPTECGTFGVENSNAQGSWALQVETDQFGDYTFNQQVALPMGFSYILSFAVRSVSGVSCTGSSLFYNNEQLNFSGSFGSSTSFTNFTFTFNNNIASSGPFQIGLYCGGGVETEFDFDSFTLVQIS
jgi:hypothetical protein